MNEALRDCPALLTLFDRVADPVGGVEKLREVILDLAVRGELAEQAFDDESVNTVLLRDRKPPKKQPKGRTGADLSAITNETEPAALPPNWEWARMFQVVSSDAPIVYGILQPGPDLGKDGVPYVRPTEMNQGKIRLSGIRTTSEDIAESYSRSQIRTNDVLLTIVGSIGKTATVPSELDGGNITQSSCRLRPDPTLMIPELLHMFLNAPIAISQYEKYRLGAAVQRLNIAHVRAIAVPLPPLAEQKRIVAKVEELMGLCDELEAAQAERERQRERLNAASLHRIATAPDDDALRTAARFHFQILPRVTVRPDQIAPLRQTILDLAVRGKLVEQDEGDEPARIFLEGVSITKKELAESGEIKIKKGSGAVEGDLKLFEIPDSWAWSQVWDVAELITSGSRDWAKYYSDSGAIFVTMGNLSKGSYKLRMDKIRYVDPPKDGEGSRTKLQKDDLLISITGDVGNLGLIPEGFGDAYINQHTSLLRFMPSARGRFFPELMRSRWAKYQFDAPQRGIKNSFRLGDVGEMWIPVPPLAEQHRIVAKVDELMSLCDELEASLTRTQTESRRLLDAVMAEIGHA